MRKLIEAQTYGMPKGGRCASCSSDERVALYELGAIEGGTPLCRRCAVKTKAKKIE